mgnify:CR=1 FL=1
MKKLSIFLILIFSLIGSAYAKDVYVCEYEWKSMGPLGYRNNSNPQDITLIVERSKVTTLKRNLRDEMTREVYKIEKKSDSSLTAMRKAKSYEIHTLQFNKTTGSFYMASLMSVGVTAYAGKCTFMY